MASLRAQAADPPVDFNRDVRPILSNKCFACHGPDSSKRQAGLRLDDAEIATHELDSGTIAVVPSKAAESELIRRITSSDADEQMPPPSFGKPIAVDEVAILRRWIDQGAKFAAHWSYVKPERPAVPEPPAQWKNWPHNDIDRFALAAMLARGMRPSPEADRAALARRVYLDLTGLPPNVAEVDAFVSNNDPLAYEKLVDDLFKRPTYGEHWARMWLDLARYADSAGYADDPPREIWAYRDWVIRALNANMPFDEFTIDQLAGDLLPNPSDDQLIATAFHRNTMTNNEGGTQDEEFRNVAIVDRVNTTMSVWMGTTMACAQCHSHKYDPLSQQEYFQLFAIFNNTEDADLRDESPLLPIYTPKQKRQLASLNGTAAAIKALLAMPTNLAAMNEAFALDSVAFERASKPSTSVPICRERTADRRETRLEYRGNYLAKGPVVTPGMPAAFHPPRSDHELDRLDFARWLVSRDNPLTARVAVNRYWEALFGRGIVATSEDFGSQGELPTHPELLDWLAVEYLDSGWNTQALLRKIVTSAVYRQSSQVTADAVKADPDNRSLARGPRVRLSAEMVRDQALAVSGLLSSKMYGPPVHPPQPNLGLNAAFGSSTDWETSQGDDRYRRALYTAWRRSNPYPAMATFDAPNREVCTLRRNSTNTPLQSLVTLNDPVFIEAAQSLARRTLGFAAMPRTPSAAGSAGGSPGAQTETVSQSPGKAAGYQTARADTEQRIASMFQRCLLRPPRTDELDSLVRLYTDTHDRLAGDPTAARKLATDPLGDLPPNVDPIDAASLTVVANVLLNLDEMFLKR